MMSLGGTVQGMGPGQQGIVGAEGTVMETRVPVSF